MELNIPPVRRVLVTGGAGFIGGNFVHHWSETRPADHLVVLDALTYAGHLATIGTLVDTGRVHFVHADIRDAEAVRSVMASHDIGTVVHFAAESHVDRSINNPGAFVETNVNGTLNLLNACRAVWQNADGWRADARFHHVSTDEVYGSLMPGDAPFTERSPYAPNSPYAASKAASDHLVRAWMHTYGLPATISNCSNNYGPYHFPEKLIPLVIVNALHGKPLPVYGDGMQVRDWLFVEDHCRAIGLILDAPVEGQTFNVGGRAEVVNIELVRSVCALLDRRFTDDDAVRRRFPHCPAAQGQPCASLIRHVADRPGHDRRYAIDPCFISTTLGFEPRESLATGLAKTVEWFVSNEQWWRSVMPGNRRR